MVCFLETTNIYKKFGSDEVLKDISIDLNEAEIIGVIGNNGAGKTTLFKIILDILSPDHGHVTFKDQNFDVKNDIGYLPEQRGLYDKADIVSQLLAFGYLKGKSKDYLIGKLDYWLEYFDLNLHRNEKLGNLSKGNQQKVQFITAVLHEPTLLILDEPFSGLDPLNVDLFTNAIVEMKNKGSSVLYSSHELDSMEDISDRLLMIHRGEIIHFDTVGNIQENYPKKLKIMNESLTEELLEKAEIAYELNGNVFEIPLTEENDQHTISALLSNKHSEMFLIDQPSLEDIFRNINRKTGE